MREFRLIDDLLFRKVAERKDVCQELFLRSDAFENENFQGISNAMQHYKATKKGEETMCKLIEDFAQEKAEKARAEGRAEGKVEGKIEGEISTAMDILKDMEKVISFIADKHPELSQEVIKAKVLECLSVTV